MDTEGSGLALVEAVRAFYADHGDWLAAAGLFSVGTFLVSLVVIPALIVALPADYFAAERRRPLLYKGGHPLLRIPLRLLKNAFGGLLLLLGLAMLVLPGQGLLTLFIAVMLLDFPGKYRFESWLLQRPAINQGTTWLRRQRGREPFSFRS